MGGKCGWPPQNFLSLMERNGTWHITPATDMTFLQIWTVRRLRKPLHSMSIAGKKITTSRKMTVVPTERNKECERIIRRSQRFTIQPFYDYAAIIKSMTIAEPHRRASFRFYISRQNRLKPLPAHHCQTLQDGWFGIKINIINTQHDLGPGAKRKATKYIARRKSGLAAEVATRQNAVEQERTCGTVWYCSWKIKQTNSDTITH